MSSVCLFLFYQESDSNGSISDDIAEMLQDLTLASHDTSYLPSSETASTASSVGRTDETDDQISKLNEFLVSCKLKPLGTKSWLEWSSASESTQRRYLDYAGDAVAALLKVLSGVNASHLWKALQTSSSTSIHVLCHQREHTWRRLQSHTKSLAVGTHDDRFYP